MTELRRSNVCALIEAAALATLMQTACGNEPAGSAGASSSPQLPMMVERSPDEQMARFVARAREDFQVPAAAVAVFSSGGLIEEAAAGLVCATSEERVTTRSPFHVGSLAKSMVAWLAAETVEGNLLNWRTSILEVFPELGGVMDRRYESVNLEDLLMHRGGFAPWWSENEFRVAEIVPGLQGSAQYQRLHFVRWLVGQPAFTDAGEVQYSNAGYVVAAAMLERVWGVAWEELIKERVFERLELQTAGIGWPQLADAGAPCGHLRDVLGELVVAPGAYHRLPAVFAPTGDVHMSVSDLARYGSQHLRGLHGYDTVLSAESVKRLHTPLGDYALGWGVASTAWGERFSSHEGSAGTFFALMVLSHDRDVGCAVVVNEGSPRSSLLASNLCFELLGSESQGSP